MRPEWLPPPLVLSGSSVQDNYDTLYTVFRRDLLTGTLSVDGVPVIVDTGMDPYLTPYERGFAHLVTRSDNSGLRTIDYARAEKLCWVKAVIDNYTQPDVRSFWFTHPSEEALYLWLHEHDFVVILKWVRSSAQTQKVLVTAYSVDTGDRRLWERRYRNASRTL